MDLLFVKPPFLHPVVYNPRLGKRNVDKKSANFRFPGPPSRERFIGCLLFASFVAGSGPSSRRVLCSKWVCKQGKMELCTP